MHNLTRREFIGCAGAGVASAFLGSAAFAAEERSAGPAIVVFSKVYQELKLNYADAAALTAEAGLAGVDCPLRPGGEVLPERVEEDLPRYVEALRKHGLAMPLLATGISSMRSPHAEKVLRTAKKLGVRYYRLDFVKRDPKITAAQQIQEWKPQLEELTALNKEIGIGALIENHSPVGKTTYLGGDLSDMRQLVESFDPEQLGVAFDIGHALAVHGPAWREHFQALGNHFKIAYVKDLKLSSPAAARKWVALGEGDVGHSGFFAALKRLPYTAPFSLHIEYPWGPTEAAKSRGALLQVLKANSAQLREFWAAA